MNKILFVHPINDFTGSTKVLNNVIKMNFKEYSKILLTMTINAGPLSELEDLQIINIIFPIYKGKKIPFLSSLISLIDRIIKMIYLCSKVDIIYINTIKPYYAAIIAQLFRKKIIWHIHEKFTQESLAAKVMEWTLSHTNAHFLFVSNYVRKQYNISNKSTFEIKYNQLDPLFLERVKVIPIKERPKNRILMICSFTKAKGIYTFVEIAKLLPQYRFTLVMSTDSTTIEKFITETHSPNNCHILPIQTNVNDIYKNNDLVLNLSIPNLCIETFGMTIIEAFAYGLPVIVPNVGGPAEIVDDKYSGRIVDVNDVGKIKEAICEILADPNYDKYAMHAFQSSKMYM